MDKQQHARWRLFTSSEMLRDSVTEQILSAADKAILEKGYFSIVLAGGTTPKEVYKSLVSAKTDWSKWHIYYGDERCLPADHADRNSVMATQHWLQAVGIPAQQIHPIPSEHGPEQAAELYEKLLNTVDIFDMVLLGLGEDGHTASLFPGHIWPTDKKVKAIPVKDAPKPPADRVSLTPMCLANTHALIFMVEGAGKLEAVKAWRAGEEIPAAVISPIGGVDVYIHENAMPK